MNIIGDTMRVIKDYIGIGVLILDQPDALEATLFLLALSFEFDLKI